MKNYLLVLLSVLGFSILGAAFTPDFDADLAATSGQEDAIKVNLMQKTALPAKIEVEEIATTAKISAPTKSTASSLMEQNYTITNVTDDLVPLPSNQDIYRTKKLVYAHNRTNLFGQLKNLRVGATVKLTENGVTTTYTVAEIGHYTKVKYLAGENLVECSANYQNCGSDVQMGLILNTAKGHRLAMMTCDGGVGTPNRLIVFLD